MRAVVDETTVQREEKFQHFYNFEDERRTIFLRFSYSSLYLCSRIYIFTLVSETQYAWHQYDEGKWERKNTFASKCGTMYRR